MALQARYFDGMTSRSREVMLALTDHGVTLSADETLVREAPWSDLEISERTRHAPRRLQFSDGAYVQAMDNAAFDTALAASGRRESWVTRWQQHWGRTFFALLLTIGVLISGYVWGVPAVARAAAPFVPDAVQRTMGEQAMKAVDGYLFNPSKLPESRQKELRDAFDAAVKAATARQDGGKPPPRYELIFRQSKMGPNAFALPGGIVVMTDELVKIAPSDAAILGVLGHEIGHLHHHHVMQRLISTSVIGSVTLLIFGDVSTVVAGAAAAVLDANYSREAETEADRFALEFMRAAGLPPNQMAQMFRAMQSARIEQARRKSDPAAQEPKKSDDSDAKDGREDSYFSSHPPTEERIRMFEQG
jgi:Zn-dependent protease with chaperone function